ncbi:hypothetical protein PoB_002562600 [Plakobranchus ocellatus]|uniref:Uncharacterized protein n=1 Tax=Plakobranchus ocellatus TaxID=259542 RepID=A0AAV3ZT12_9GAST|nr:hypothetical protein PoB_002562600 [Plakobranchus ocellatus]
MEVRKRSRLSECVGWSRATLQHGDRARVGARPDREISESRVEWSREGNKKPIRIGKKTWIQQTTRQQRLLANRFNVRWVGIFVFDGEKEEPTATN